MGKTYREIKIPDEIIRKIEEQIKGTEFTTVEDYVAFVLEEVVKDTGEEEQEPEETFSEEDEKKVKERLKALGYLD